MVMVNMANTDIMVTVKNTDVDMVTAMVKIIQGHKYSPKKINFILLN